MTVGYFIKDEDMVVIELNAIIKGNVWEGLWGPMFTKFQPPVKKCNHSPNMVNLSLNVHILSIGRRILTIKLRK